MTDHNDPDAELRDHLAFEAALGGVNPSDFYTACSWLKVDGFRQMTERNADGDTSKNVIIVLYGKPKLDLPKMKEAIGAAASQFFEAMLIGSEPSSEK
jgi:hypothetical protein